MNWKVIAKSLKHKDMRKRMFAVVGIIIIFRVLAHIPIPFGDPQTVKQVLDNLFASEATPQLLNFLNVISGGALANFSIMVAGLGPYINASIILQLLTRAIPQLEQLRKDGESGQRKINQYTRLLTFPLAIIQSVGAIYLIRQAAQSVSGVGDITADADLMQWVLMISALTAGSMILMWLGEQVTEQSIGNGISLLITAGIVSALPKTFGGLTAGVFGGDNVTRIFGYDVPVNGSGLLYVSIIIGVVVGMTWSVVKLNEGQRRLTVNYAKRVQGNRTYGGVTTTLPIKLITAGVVPIIFAVAFLSVPTFAGQLMSGSSSARIAEIGSNLALWFQAPTAQSLTQGDWHSLIYPVTYFLLVVMFTFFYTSITFNAKDIAENLQKQGGFIEGVRSGAQTEKYLSKVSSRLTLFGALSIGTLAMVPIFAQLFVTADVTLGGTGLLILVSVSLETLRAVESRALMITYDQYASSDYFSGGDDDEEVGAKKKHRLRLIPRRKVSASSVA
jgi:preprotein translocase subunit SecY